jgi:hypothetical protein
MSQRISLRSAARPIPTSEIESSTSVGNVCMAQGGSVVLEAGRGSVCACQAANLVASPNRVASGSTASFLRRVDGIMHVGGAANLFASGIKDDVLGLETVITRQPVRIHFDRDRGDAAGLGRDRKAELREARAFQFPGRGCERRARLLLYARPASARRPASVM